MKQTLFKILVYDKESVLSGMINVSLLKKEMNCQFLFSKHLEECIAKLSSENIDVFFVGIKKTAELSLPFLKKIRKTKQQLPIVLLGPTLNSNSYNKMIAAGATECISIAAFNPSFLQVFIRQLSYRRKMEMELKTSKQNGIDGVRKQFLTEISHKIRNPLNSIIGFSGALLGMERSEREIEFLEAIKISGENILRLIDKGWGSPEVKNTTGATMTVRVKKPLTNVHFNEIIKLKILLVEDDPFNIKLVEHLFSEYGMKATVALNGKQAIEKIAKNYYDLVLMDMEMPLMDGYEATKYTRTILKNNVPIIALTANAMEGEREKCLAMGMNEYITKPINPNLLFEIIYRTIKPGAGIADNSIESVTDLNALKESMKGKKEAIREMLDYFSKKLPQYIAELNSAIKKKEYDTITHQSKKIKTFVSRLGIKQLIPVLAEMEAAGSTNGPIGKIKSLNKQLNYFVGRAITEIKTAIIKFK